MAKSDEICGEVNPGFTLWTSAHGFHHYTLSNRRGWKCCWAFILFVLVVSLLACIAYYFYYVFSTAVYSRIILESPENRDWPTTIICERQAFTLSRISSVPSLTVNHASLLSWSLGAELARPDVYSTDSRIDDFNNEIDIILDTPNYNGNLNKLIMDMAPNCTQFILECQLGNVVYNGASCCSQIFNPSPIITQHGTCYTTKGAPLQHQVTIAGEGSGLTVVTMHDNGNSFDRSLASSSLFGSTGVNFAIVDGTLTIDAALRSQGQSVQPGTYATVGISRTLVDNSDLELSAIGRMKCTVPGTTTDVDSDLIIGQNEGYGYTKDSCVTTAKRELLSRELLDCTFNPSSSTTFKRCSPVQSAQYYRSFIDSNNTAMDKVDVVQVKDKAGLTDRYAKTCQQDCIQDRYSVSPSYSTISDNLKAELQKKIPDTAPSTSVVVLKFFMNSLEYTRIHNFPQPGLQFVAEVGGLMAFFLGLSLVSILECMCYCCICTVRKCGGDEVEGEDRWQEQQQVQQEDVEDEETARRRAHHRQKQFEEIQAKLRRADHGQIADGSRY